MPKITAPHMNTAICCILGSVMRGTFSASAIVANERVPSRVSQSSYKQNHWFLDIHMAATIWVSSPNWLEKPPAK